MRRNFFERSFEKLLWRSRFFVIFAVIMSMLMAIVMFWIASADVAKLIQLATKYPDLARSAVERKTAHDEIISRVLEALDGYLLASVMVIFSFGLYELFISNIDDAHRTEGSSKILAIESLDDLKVRLSQAIMLVLIVTVFREALHLKINAPIDLVYLGGSVMLVGLALFLAKQLKASIYQKKLISAEMNLFKIQF